jgi:hypothetical protein
LPPWAWNFFSTDHSHAKTIAWKKQFFVSSFFCTYILSPQQNVLQFKCPSHNWEEVNTMYVQKRRCSKWLLLTSRHCSQYQTAMYLHVSTGMAASLQFHYLVLRVQLFFYYTLNASGITTRKSHVKLHQASPLV